MADRKNQNSPVLVIICALGLLAFLLVVIYPNYRALKTYDRQIATTNAEIALRQTLAPIYRELIERVRLAPATRLKVVEKSSLDRADTGRLTQIFEAIAESACLTLESVVPDAQAFAQGDGRLQVDVVFRGDFLNIQTLINTLVEHAFVERILNIHLNSTQENKWIKLSVALLHR
ncbi:MAG: hypothetical protein R6V78_14690 [Desulfosarcina sp.]